MYPNYNMVQNMPSMYQKQQNFNRGRVQYGNNNDRIVGGALAPFLLGGIAGYAFGRPNFNTYPYPYPYSYSYNNFYYPPYYYYY